MAEEEKRDRKGWRGEWERGWERKETCELTLVTKLYSSNGEVETCTPFNTHFLGNK
jgi:hypothetical protein